MAAPDDFCTPGAAGENPRAAAKIPAQDRGVTVSSLCSMGWRPIMVTGMLIDLLAQKFADPVNIEDQSLQSLVWREDERATILIEDVYSPRKDLLQMRPAILVKRNAMKNLRMYLGERSGVTGQGHLEYTTYWIGSHTLFCIHKSGASVEILGTEVQRTITEWAQSLIKSLRLMQLSVLDYGAVSLIEESKDGFVLPITVGWAYEQSWRIELESLALRKTPLSVLLNGALVNKTE